MTFVHASAREWAAEHSTAMAVRLGRLETIAFQHHPGIHRHFGSDGALYASAPRPQRSRLAQTGTAVLVTLAISGVAAPAAAVAVLGADRFEFFRMDAARSVPLAGVLFLIAAVTQIVLLVRWVRAGARYDGFTAGIVLVAAVFSGFGLVAFPNIAAYPGSTGWQNWYPATVVTFAISVLSLVAQLVRRGTRRSAPVAEPPAMPAGGDPSEIARLIAQLPESERAGIEADREAALQILHARGLIDDATLARARATPLGQLHSLDDEFAA
ncbi:hypothetical protein [Microbacterium sp. zg.Y909]|uniref:hypothetical protein n=1 Tax=Microbacterium sp. zg.Y909 TaxID=2969413 RepID=UPI00214CA8F4|nr:hypothetical protein [Microbacterium sp. zg.Y909]MCR2825719.1 hypothetical protein [Microbacterium sp. zg.Y909]